VFERFTDRARRVVVLAQEEARLLNHNYIGTEHILLGLIHEGGVAASALAALDIDLNSVRRRVEQIIGHGGTAPSGHIPFTPRAKKVLELSLREALQLGHNYIGTEHILLGLIREGEGVAAEVLVSLGADLARVRQQVVQILSGDQGGLTAVGSDVSFASPLPAAPIGTCSFCARDLWEVDHYAVGPGGFICDVCIGAAHAALTAAPEDEQVLVLPPRVFGTPPADDPHAVEHIAASLRAVFAAAPGDASIAHLEDGEQLMPILQSLRERFGHLHVRDVTVDRMRFSGTSPVAVGFALVLDTGTRLAFTGTVHRSGGHWVVSRTTVANIVRAAGVSLPPPPEGA
jgi:hypothetical protein